MTEPFIVTNYDIVLNLLGNDLILAKMWWHSPNQAFDMQHPINVDKNTVRSYLESFIQ
jgi:hypothetical protein